MNRRTESAPAPSLRGVTGPSHLARTGTARTSSARTAHDPVPTPPTAVSSLGLENTMYAMSHQIARAHIERRHEEAARWRIHRAARAARKAQSAARKAQSAARKAEAAQRRARLALEDAALDARELDLAIAR